MNSMRSKPLKRLCGTRHASPEVWIFSKAAGTLYADLSQSSGLTASLTSSSSRMFIGRVTSLASGMGSTTQSHMSSTPNVLLTVFSRFIAFPRVSNLCLSRCKKPGPASSSFPALAAIVVASFRLRFRRPSATVSWVPSLSRKDSKSWEEPLRLRVRLFFSWLLSAFRWTKALPRWSPLSITSSSPSSTSKMSKHRSTGSSP
mmetsp:Transcript_93180/g.199895  ORF Transcript_93180/g.199895 Transcript_93180/m.199895 type:complete len:202 (+) Transcript_93180:1431-2036(+)